MPTSMGNGTSVERVLELTLAALVAAGLGGLLLAVVGIFKAPQVVVLGLIATWGYARFTANGAQVVAPRATMPAWHLLFLLLVAIFFRLPAINYVSGGQDQGVYVNMAAHIAQTGGIAFDDRVGARIGGTNAAAIYHTENAPVNGDFLPGLFERDAASGPFFEFQFYHLFPVYMAIIGGIFGLDASVAALTMLSLLSVLFFYCMALELTGRNRIALAAGFLLAINPLHAFFSRFPVTEVAFLCFALAAGWLLLSAWRDPSGERDAGRRWAKVLLSVAALTCAFLIRVSGFMYVPIILLIGIAACLHEPDRQSRRLVFAWALLANFGCAASVAYGYLYSSIYTEFILGYAFKALGPHWGIWVLTIWGSALAGMALLYVADPEQLQVRWLRRLANHGRRWLGILAPIALVLWLYKLYPLGWTDRYAADPWLAQRWHIAGTGANVFRYSSLIVACEYLSPLLLILFVWQAWNRRLQGALSILLVFVLMFLFYIVGPQWLVAYQPYYARYLVSEFVPYLILFVVAAVPFIVSKPAKRTAIAALGASAVYAIVLSVGQLRANEQHGVSNSYQRVVSHVADDDLLLLDVSSLSLPYQWIEMPFALRYQRHVARITPGSMLDAGYLNGLQGRFDRLYLLSGSAAAPPGFLPVDSVRFREWVAEQGAKPPLKSAVRFHGRTYLYMRPGAVIVPGESMEIGALGGPSSSSQWNGIFARGWSIPESWGMWSNAVEAQIDVPRVLTGGKRTRLLTLVVKPFTTGHHPLQRVSIDVDGISVFSRELSGETTLRIPLADHPSIDTAPHRVRFALPDAVTPREAGLESNDPRRLAIGLLSVRLDVDGVRQME